jgi:DNA polymerase-3 subunit gamma/tau
MSQTSSYLVLARKYRPQNFSELAGQEVLVQTLSNSIKTNRLHHAYILTGIRGVGKTTTARIIAKTVNCLNRAPDSVTSCGICDNCRLISASKHQDVIEIDAASRTGVDDIREIIDSIAYAPVMANYKIYIIDEVHMLSNNAFNALLKTLEEPPAHVKFIFATTELKKVPITILSRCQRFNLRRLDESEIANHLKNILQKEGIESQPEALELIAKMSEGSVRDSLSLLDQALVNKTENILSSELVEKMLGLNDKLQVIELLEAMLSGNFPQTLEIFKKFYTLSSDISQLLSDLLEVTHKITSVKLITGYKLEGYSKAQQEKIAHLAKNTSLNSLTRIWQMLNKGVGEVNFSDSPKMAFEMLMVRICHLVALPNLAQVLTDLDKKTHILKSHLEEAEKPQQKTNSVISSEKIDDEVVKEILRSFEDARLVA